MHNYLLRLSAVLGLLVLFPIRALMQEVAHDPVIADNRYYTSYDKYDEIPLNSSMGGQFLPGRGIDMSNPDDPRLRPLVAFTHKIPDDAALNSIVNSQNTASNYQEATSAYEEARILNVYFQAKFAFASFSAALDQAKNDRSNSRSLYLLIEKSGGADVLVPREAQWSAAPRAESITDASERYRQFLDDYGSHYIQSVRYGMRIAIRAKLNSTSSSEFQKFSAAFKASFGIASSASGGVTDEMRREMSSYSMEVDATILGHASGGDTVLTGFEQIAKWVSSFNKGDIKVTEVPIGCLVNSYWATLSDYPKCRSLFSNAPFARLTAEAGVPKGTVLSWSPPSEAIKKSEDGKTRTIVAPEGWEICDGRAGTPDLRNKFIMGTADASSLLALGGSATHTHSGQALGPRPSHANPDSHGGSNSGNPPQVTGIDHTHGLQIADAANLPPYMTLVYIIKL